MHALNQPQWGAYWCEKGAFTPNPNDWHGLCDIYDVLPATAPTTPAVTPEDATATNGGTGNTTPTPTPTPTVVPTVEPTVVTAWEPTDRNIKRIKKSLAT